MLKYEFNKIYRQNMERIIINCADTVCIHLEKNIFKDFYFRQIHFTLKGRPRFYTI